MAWKHVGQMVFGSALVLAQTKFKPAATDIPPAPEPVRVSVEEILSYECARSITSLVLAPEPVGPLFSQGKLVFTSLEAQDFSKILLVNAGYGNFSIALASAGVNRIRFELPTASTGSPHLFYLSYLHGGALRSRFFEFSEGHAPAGRDEKDFPLVSVHRAENLLPHLNYAIDQTAAATLLAITDGKVQREQMGHHRIENCDNIPRQSPDLAGNFRHNLDMLDLIVSGAEASSGSRAPASVRGL